MMTINAPLGLAVSVKNSFQFDVSACFLTWWFTCELKFYNFLLSCCPKTRH